MDLILRNNQLIAPLDHSSRLLDNVLALYKAQDDVICRTQQAILVPELDTGCCILAPSKLLEANMLQARKLTRLGLKLQDLDSIIALPGTAKCRAVRFISSAASSTRYDARKISDKAGQPILARPPVALAQQQLSFQFRLASGAANVKQISMHDIGEGISEVEIKVWHVNVGDTVKEFDLICEVESDKANAPITSRYEGLIRALHHEVGDKAKVGKPLFDIEVTSGSDSASEVQQQPPAPLEENQATISNSAPTNRIVQALPSVRRFAQEMNVDLSQVKATGSRGQVLREDVLAYLNRSASSARNGTKVENDSVRRSIPSGPNQHEEQAIRLVPLRGIQKAMFRTMTESLKIPHFNYADEIDLTQLVEAKSSLQHHTGQTKIANLAFIIKMVSLALLEYPQLNASIDESEQNLIHKSSHNIGVAVDTQAGLIVPNIKNVQNLSVEQVNSELLRLRELGYASKLGQADLSGATITLSNIGAVGGMFGVPVIVSPEIVIGALGRTRKLPRFNSQGQLEAFYIMQLVWSADHRVVDGATLSRFSNLLKSFLENPHAALLKLT